MRLLTVHAHPKLGFTACFWTLRPDGTWEQERPLRALTLAGARAHKGEGAQPLPVPPDFAVEAWEVRS